MVSLSRSASDIGAFRFVRRKPEASIQYRLKLAMSRPKSEQMSAVIGEVLNGMRRPSPLNIMGGLRKKARYRPRPMAKID